MVDCKIVAASMRAFTEAVSRWQATRETPRGQEGRREIPR